MSTTALVAIGVRETQPTLNEQWSPDRHSKTIIFPVYKDKFPKE